MSLWIPVDGELHMRLFEPELAKRAYSVIDANREHIGRWLPWTNTTHSPDDCATFARAALHDFANRKQLALLIMDGEQVIGGTGWTDWRLGERYHGVIRDGSAEIGYWLAADAQGKGIMTRCVARLIDLAFDHYDMYRLIICVEPDNDSSNAVPRRLGFSHEGTFRKRLRWGDRWVDAHIWAIHVDDWVSKKVTC